MKRTSLANWPCSIARTMDLIGDWWTPLVLREAFAGIRRFDDFQESLGLARNTLNARLQRLVEEGLLDRVRYQQRPDRYEYVLTEKGEDFYPVLAAIMAWGDRWLAGESGPPVITRHTCGQATHGVVVCEHCAQPLTAGSVTKELGPGFPARLADREDVRARFGPRPE
ncbi:helix-turn-helix domain-containing protein [Saccharopolyspora shandongensis]|uniref:Transcriptional regulator n=2 Tax=Saccharopolyspora TaxID=1835 RepID=A0A4R4ZCD5_9PSEU|nr:MULTISPECIES: helix-turn-helix domain-containing protein [Saccharopolyspora]TDD56043.1 transcriptional regulator [Saccharopolyspora elongata]SDZ31492.1 transcriptional regulator, HxlR family [Saccharopolyspora shandongensis]